MKRQNDEKVGFCNKLDSIHPDLKLKITRLPAKFRMKAHQKKPFCRRVESMAEELDNEADDEKEMRPIPLDLLEANLLNRLPGKSLMRFRCVSKMWSSIIRSQRFIDSFSAMSSARSRFIIAFSSNGAFAPDDANRLFIFSSSYEAEESSSLVANLDMVVPSASLNRASKCASVNGFVGFRNHGAQFVVCNPSTGQVLPLPCRPFRTCLGYDPVDNQFKALTLVTPPYQDHHAFLVHEVLTLGGGSSSSSSSSSWRRTKVSSPPYFPVTEGLCIKGFLYQGAWAPRQRMDPVIVCFDVRYERLSLIKAPKDAVVWESDSVFIEYKGKFAAIVTDPYAPFHSFDLWVLEDVDKHDWSKQTFELPLSLVNMTSPGTNKAGEIIFAPKSLSRHVQPFYIFYYNVERRDIRRLVLHGIADDESFRRAYGLVDQCFVSISPEHVDCIVSL